MKFRTKITALNLALIMLICGIFIGRAIPKSEPKIPSVTPVYEDVLQEHFYNMGYLSIDGVDFVDKYPDGDWYCYYVYTCGDCYIITLKNGKVDICQQLN